MLAKIFISIMLVSFVVPLIFETRQDYVLRRRGVRMSPETQGQWSLWLSVSSVVAVSSLILAIICYVWGM